MIEALRQPCQGWTVELPGGVLGSEGRSSIRSGGMCAGGERRSASPSASTERGSPAENAHGRQPETGSPTAIPSASLASSS